MTASLLLILGWRAIRSKKIGVHRALMTAAFVVSIIFLGSYVTYHVLSEGPTRYPGEGFFRIVYLGILITHTPLALLVVPASLLALYYAIKGNFSAHVRITRWLLPVWIYVSVTGVLIYVLLYQFPL